MVHNPADLAEQSAKEGTPFPPAAVVDVDSKSHHEEEGYPNKGKALLQSIPYIWIVVDKVAGGLKPVQANHNADQVGLGAKRGGDSFSEDKQKGGTERRKLVSLMRRRGGIDTRWWFHYYRVDEQGGEDSWLAPYTEESD